LALPVVAVIGRPNVGKSTLVNRLCRSREAIVHDQPGVTRDRTYQEGFWGDRIFRVVDTGGLVFDDDSEFLPEIREQANLALAEASVAVVIVDGQQGVTAADESIAAWLRGHNVPVLLGVNTCESPDQGLAMAADFWGLGLGEPVPISAEHGEGMADLYAALAAVWAEDEDEEKAEDESDKAHAAAFADWGIPTARAIAEIRAACPGGGIIGSGGIRDGVEAAKAIRLGADMVGQAAGVLTAAMVSTEAVVAHFQTVIRQMRTVCFCTGSANLTALRRAPLQD
jgi:small GTP-binding protein